MQAAAEKPNQLAQAPDYSSAATRNIDLMAQEKAVLGYVTPELEAMILDEEWTHGMEVLAAQEAAYGAVPRTFYQRGEDLIDIHGQSLRRVITGGIEWSLDELSRGVPGADWELKRRRAELSNLETIIAMPAGSMCVETSAPPVDKPKGEQLAQHYNGLTMIRVTINDGSGRILQYNYALPVANPEFLQTVQAKLGIDSAEQLTDSQQLLERPFIQKIDQSAATAAREVDNLVGAALLEGSVGHSALRMIRRAIEHRREAWKFVTSPGQADINRELLNNMARAATLSPAERKTAMDAIRSGYWKELKDRFNGNRSAVAPGGIIAAAASRAVAAGDVFIACGATVEATELSTSVASANRSVVANSLRAEVKGSGSCTACGAKGVLYGCGVYCKACNEVWCREFELTGNQLDAKNLSYLRYSRGEVGSIVEKPIQILAEDWQRLNRETQQRRLEELKGREQLANSA